MKRARYALFGVVLTALAHGQVLEVENVAELPQPITNNAVAAVTVDAREYVVSFNGLAAGKTYADTTAATFVLDVESGKWSTAAPVPGGVGRLAAAATALGERVFVFGGYTVAEDGSEVSTPWVHSFDVVAGTYREREPMPVPVDDMVVLPYADRFIYLLSGWHDVGNVNLVQRYDAERDRWDQATPISGPAVFGHAGGIVEGRIVYCDGVAIAVRADRSRDFVATNQCYLGSIDPSDGRRIDWRTIDPHPGPARYRMAAAGVAEMNGILFIGGTDNPYNYNGIGYDGRPSSPLSGALLFDLTLGQWHSLEQPNLPSMDHRGLVRLGHGWATVGGMLDGQEVSADVTVYRLSQPQ